MEILPICAFIYFGFFGKKKNPGALYQKKPPNKVIKYFASIWQRIKLDLCELYHDLRYDF